MATETCPGDHDASQKEARIVGPFAPLPKLPDLGLLLRSTHQGQVGLNRNVHKYLSGQLFRKKSQLYANQEVRSLYSSLFYFFSGIHKNVGQNFNRAVFLPISVILSFPVDISSFLHCVVFLSGCLDLCVCLLYVLSKCVFQTFPFRHSRSFFRSRSFVRSSVRPFVRLSVRSFSL